MSPDDIKDAVRAGGLDPSTIGIVYRRAARVFEVRPIRRGYPTVDALQRALEDVFAGLCSATFDGRGRLCIAIDLAMAAS